jgi:hypothetical protein
LHQGFPLKRVNPDYRPSPLTRQTDDRISCIPPSYGAFNFFYKPLNLIRNSHLSTSHTKYFGEIARKWGISSAVIHVSFATSEVKGRSMKEKSTVTRTVRGAMPRARQQSPGFVPVGDLRKREGRSSAVDSVLVESAFRNEQTIFATANFPIDAADSS